MLTLNEIKWLGKDLAEYQPLENDTMQRNFHASDAGIRWLFGGNQSGKSHTNMIDLSQLSLNIHPFKSRPNGIHWACIESWEQVRDILWEGYLKKFILPHHITKIMYGQEKVPKKIYLRNGTTIEFKAFNQGRTLFQGRQIDSIYCDEQCIHDYKGILDEMQARLLIREGFLSWSMTPIIPQVELEERIEELPDTDEVFYANLNSNRKSQGGYVSDKRIDALISEWPEEVQATRIKGRFASFYGAVYKTFSRSVHLVKPFIIPKEWRRYRGFDFGFTNPFVCLWMAQDKDDNWYVYREYYKPKEVIGTHIEAVHRLSKFNVEKYLSIADPENAENRKSMLTAGIPTKIARKDVAKGIECVQGKLKVKDDGKPSLFIFNTCRHTAMEMASYHYPTGSKNKNPADVPVPKNDHCCDALRYVIYTVERPMAKGSIYAA